MPPRSRPRMRPAQEVSVFDPVRTEIVCTLGPKSDDQLTIEALVRAGADAIRLNFSHGTHEAHLRRIMMVRNIARHAGRAIAIFADLSGPKIRIGDVAGGEAKLIPGRFVTLTPEKATGGDGRFELSFKQLARCVKKGDPILLDDGALEFAVARVDGDDVLCEVVTGGVLKPQKGVNLPRTHLPIPAMTVKDRADLKFALDHGVDAVALSFVRRSEDVKLARKAMQRFHRIVPIIAKIEKAEAVENLDEILRTADGAMVARGDLGVEMPVEQVAGIQKRVIRICNRLGKPVITATQMLDSMIRNPLPTRAEVTDIYNAVHDGTDALMLSGETAAGAYPVESVEMMVRIAREAERTMPYYQDSLFELTDPASNTAESITRHAVQIARDLNLDAIVIPTESGSTARRVARYRPKCHILAGSVHEDTVNYLNFTWGVFARLMPQVSVEDEETIGSGEAVVRASIATFKSQGILRRGMRVVVLAGMPLRTRGTTNFLRVIEVP